MPRQYASGTYVGVGRSKDEIEQELRRLGTSRRAFLDDDEAGQAVVMFEREHTRYKLILPYADRNDRRFTYTPAGRQRRSPNEADAAWQQDCRERWRALAAYVKILRVSAEAGIITIETALLPYATLPDGTTVAEFVLPQLDEAANTRRMPPLLPGATPPAPRVTFREEENDHERD